VKASQIPLRPVTVVAYADNVKWDAAANGTAHFVSTLGNGQPSNHHWRSAASRQFGVVLYQLGTKHDGAGDHWYIINACDVGESTAPTTYTFTSGLDVFVNVNDVASPVDGGGDDTVNSNFSSYAYLDNTGGYDLHLKVTAAGQ
jgi:hypothetical protein